MKKSYAFTTNVFINCPFDDAYDPLFVAILFTVHRFGLRPRCSSEVLDSGKSRLEKIIAIMADSKYGIHDISRIELTKKLPRFNMPFELGIDIGFLHAGGTGYRTKCYLIMDKTRYRYQQVISDLNGRDPSAHYNRERDVVCNVRDWLASATGIKGKPSGHFMFQEFKLFKRQIPKLCDELDLDPSSLMFLEYSDIIAAFLKGLKAHKSRS